MIVLLPALSLVVLPFLFWLMVNAGCKQKCIVMISSIRMVMSILIISFSSISLNMMTDILKNYYSEVEKMKISFKEKITRFLNSLCDELRACIEHRYNKPKTPKLHKIGSLAIVFCIVLYVLIGCFGAIRSSAADNPSTLANSSWYVYVNFDPSSSRGIYKVNGFYAGDKSFTEVRIGYTYYDGSWYESSYDISFVGDTIYSVPNDGNFYRFTVDFVDGVDINSSALLNWFIQYGSYIGTFTPPSSDVNVPAGLYFLQNTYNDLRGTINFSVPFLSKSSYFSSIEFVGVENDQYVSINYVDSQDNITDVFYASEGWQDAEYSVILIQTDTSLSADEYELFSSAFVSFADNPDLQTLFSAGQLNGQSFGYSQGYSAGESAGYENGFANGQAEGMSQGFMSNFFGGIVQALDALKLFGSFSVLNIIEGVLGLMLALWVLKLIAGG